MNILIQLYILSIFISLYEGSMFIGLPESNWTTSSRLCSLPGIDEIKTTEIRKDLLWYMNIYKHEIVWTGTVIKYTKWAAFIGCGRSFSPLDLGISVKTAEDCLKHCSDHSSATHFVIKNSTCFCVVDKPEINEDNSDCRKECANAIYTPCSSGRSALVFTFVKDFYIEKSNTFIEKECLITTNKDKTRLTLSHCNEEHLYGCTNTSAKLIPKSWYDYQEICLKRGYHVLYNRDIKGGANVDQSVWTPIFRSHTVVTGKPLGKDMCLALSTKGSHHFTVRQCSSEFPFICSRIQRRNNCDISITKTDHPRNSNFPDSATIAVILFVIFLIFLIVIISIKSYRRIRMYQEKLKRVNERLPGTEFSNYTGIEVSNEEENDFGYNEMSDNVLQLRTSHHDREINKQEDTVDEQGYLILEQHYHTIPEVEVHYATADEERNSNKKNSHNDDYLEPVI
ncbi:uncharacterized protein LOC143045583 [Mytilus galloprovincialis]|uniref:uncharacterized protein LOC143045583 n=1 Tax=Mytilus galloprovincialis TaxID=29158 RepID=UPI003F7B5045